MDNLVTLLTKEQQIRYGFYKEFNNDAQKAYDFVMQHLQIAQAEPVSIPKALIPEPSSNQNIEDGVYLIDVYDNAVKFVGDDTETLNDTAYIGVVMGSHRLKVALKDSPKSTLTNRENNTEYDGYIDEYDDAVADWNGQKNTEHIKSIGTDIQLAEGEWIPSVAELYLIYLNKRAINAALKFVGGEPIKNAWYWSSTEYSSTYAWLLRLNAGTLLSWYGKVRHSGSVRAVAAFR